MSLNFETGRLGNRKTVELELTIVIPTINRPQLLKRALDYWGVTDYSVIVADGSESAFSGDLPDNVRYIHDAISRPWERWHDALCQVKTPYVAVCGEDDFLSMNGVKQCLEFLNSNKDYVSAQGHGVEFTVDGMDNIAVGAFMEKRAGMHIDADTADERMHQLFEEVYMFQMFSVYRTHMLQLVLASVKKQKNMTYVELGAAMIPTIFGKHRILPVFYYARENVTGSSTGTVECPRFDVQNRSGADDFVKYCDIVAKIYADADNVSREVAVAIVDRTFAEYFAWDQRTFPSRCAVVGTPKQSLRYRFRKLMPSPLLKLRRLILEKYRERQADPGYPWSDEIAYQEWRYMVDLINKHLT